jgi:cytochrome c
VYINFLFRTSVIALGIALLLAGLFFDGGSASSVNQQATPTSTLSPFERLAKPTLPARSSQSDVGAQDYWLYCLPCHGDRGQGLTLEFRETYPPDEVNCWQAGCHGKRPYENGFTLPTNIPAVIGQNALQKFSNAAVLQSYIFAAMPYWKPGSLEVEDTWQITAFLLRENGLWNSEDELDASNAMQVVIHEPEAAPTHPEETDQSVAGASVWALVLAPVIIILLIALQRWFRRDSSIK